MENIFRKAISVMLIVVMVLCSAPLAGFVGLELSEINLFTTKAEAATYEGTCGENLTWTLDDSTGELVISGTGDMYDWPSSEMPWYHYRSSIKTVTISDGVTSIVDEAFYSCTSLASITIPDSVTSIGNSAFAYCTNLTSITIPDSVTSIGNNAFYNCTSLVDVYYTGDVAGWCGINFANYCSTPMCYADNLYINGILLEGNVVIPDGVTSIGNFVFYNRANLTSITIPDSVTSIGTGAFYNCESLTNVTIPDSVTSIGNSAFAYCTNLTSITIPDSVTSIDNGAFCGCASLVSIKIPDGVTSIGMETFGDCKSLTSITISDSIKSIGGAAFSGCENLTDVYYTGSMAQWFNVYIEEYNQPLVNANIHYLGEKYTVTLDTNGGAFADGSNEKIYEFVFGDKLVLEEPQREEYEFIGWALAGDNNNTVITLPETMPAENLELKAVFEGNPYTVTWIIDGLEMPETYRAGSAIDKTKTFNKKGYTFVGWTPEIPDTMPAQNLEFTAAFAANLYDAVFNTNGGTFPDGDLFKRVPTAYNTAIAVPQNPEKNGYKFAGWSYNGKNIGTNLGIMDSIEGKVFEALWIPTETITYTVETNIMNTFGEYEVYAVHLNGTANENVSANPVIPDGFELNTEKVSSAVLLMKMELLLSKFILTENCFRSLLLRITLRLLFCIITER